MISRWTADLPRALCRALIAALVAVVIAALLVRKRDRLMGLEVALAIGAAMIPLTLAEGRLEARRPKLSTSASCLLLCAVAFALWAVLLAQTAWVIGLAREGLDGALDELGDLARHLDAGFCAVGFVTSACVGLASFRRLERRRGSVVSVPLVTLFLGCTIVLGALYLASYLVLWGGDALAAAWARRRAPAGAGSLRALVACGLVSPERLWLLAYLGDAEACDALRDEPGADAPRDLRGWVVRLERGGAAAPARAALALAHQALPALRAARSGVDRTGSGPRHSSDQATSSGGAPAPRPPGGPPDGAAFALASLGPPPDAGGVQAALDAAQRVPAALDAAVAAPTRSAKAELEQLACALEADSAIEGVGAAAAPLLEVLREAARAGADAMKVMDDAADPGRSARASRAAQHAARAAEAFVAAGRAPDEVREVIADALLAWAAPAVVSA